MLEKYPSLKAKYCSDCKKYKVKPNFSEFTEITNQLISIFPDKIGVEASKGNRLYYHMCKDGDSIHVEVFLTHIYPNMKYETVLNIFNNKKSILCVSGSFREMMNTLINKYLSDDKS